MKRKTLSKSLLSDLLTGVLIVILSAILSTLLPAVGWVWHTTDAQLFYRIVDWLTIVLTSLLTCGSALWIAHKRERGAPLHGLLVGLFVALIYFFSRLYFRSPAQALDTSQVLVAFLLIGAAGWFGGVWGSLRRKSYGPLENIKSNRRFQPDRGIQ